MIIRKRSKPLILQKYEALQARLPENIPIQREIGYEIQDSTRGYEGELIVDNYLRTLANQFTILQDVTLESSGSTFQMDSLLITPNAIYIIEVKNFSRPIHFDTNLNQFTSGTDNQITGYRHPITQVKTQQLRLTNWLFEHNQPNIPIRSFIAISEPSTLINVIGDPDKISNIVLHAEHLPWKIMEYEEQSNKTNTQPFLHQKVGHAILNHCKEFDIDILKKHGVLPEQLLRGVRCKQCNGLTMERFKWSWICKNCNVLDKEAANRGINEYLLLVKPWITNREIRNYLQIDSRYVVSRLLKNHPNLQYSNRNKRWEKKFR